MKNKILLIILVLLFTKTTKAQTPWYLTGNTPLNTDFLGSTNAADLIFKTNNTEAARLIGLATNYQYFFGVGKVDPHYNLTVAHHICIDTLIVYPDTTNKWIGSYMLGDTTILHNKGINNTFCGHLSGVKINGGFSNAFFGKNAGRMDSTGSFNVFVGDSAGARDKIGKNNVCVGFHTGSNNDSDDNVFVGSGAAGPASSPNGMNTWVGNGAGGSASGDDNSFFGFGAGLTNSGSDNSYFGASAASGASSGKYNCAFGYTAAQAMTGTDNCIFGKASGQSIAGNDNCLYGTNSGLNWKNGSFNVLIGDSAAFSNHKGGLKNTFIGSLVQNVTDSINNSVVLGANAIVRSDKKMILGDSMIWVGIGLSNDATGPQKPLEINARNNTTGAVVHTHPGGSSGLRFRQLTKADTAGAPIGKVLTVNDSGDVVLVRDSVGSGSGGGTGTVTTCGSPTTNYVTKFSTVSSGDTAVCNSIIYDDGTNVAVGNGASTTGDKLYVNGDIDVPSGIANAYSIGGQPFMWTYGSGSNTYLGTGVNAANPTLGTNNTFLGSAAGSVNNGGSGNTFVGLSSGISNTTGNGNVFLGQNSGTGNTIGINNIIIGNDAASTTASSSENIFIGVEAGNAFAGTGNDENVFIGNQSGFSDNLGVNNTLIGYQAGNRNTTGSGITCLGNGANVAAISLGFNTAIGTSAMADSSYSTAVGATAQTFGRYSTALGYGAIALSDYAISLGDNNASVLIGYSGSTIPSISADSTARLYVNSLAGGRAAYFAGNIYAHGVIVGSDSKIKTNIQDIQDPNSILDRITGKSFTYNTETYPSLNLPSGSHFGVIAQDVEAVMPSAVESVTSPQMYDSTGNVIAPSVTYKAVNYTELIPLLIASNKQQRQSIDSLRSQLAQLQATVANCCASSTGANERTMAPSGSNANNGNVIPVDLHNAILLEQNSPNPFAEHTTIKYNVGSEVQNAQIVFFDNIGHILKAVTISERGPGMLDVYAGDLSSGLYSYSLIADGQVLDTKKMVRMK